MSSVHSWYMQVLQCIHYSTLIIQTCSLCIHYSTLMIQACYVCIHYNKLMIKANSCVNTTVYSWYLQVRVFTLQFTHDTSMFCVCTLLMIQACFVHIHYSTLMIQIYCVHTLQYTHDKDMFYSVNTTVHSWYKHVLCELLFTHSTIMSCVCTHDTNYVSIIDAHMFRVYAHLIQKLLVL